MKNLGLLARFPRGFFLLVGILTLAMSGFALIQTLIVGYVHNVLNINIAQAIHLNTLFTTLLFSLPLLSAFIVGRFMGLLLSTFMSLLLATAGLYLLCFQSLIYFYTGLALFCVGNSIAVANLYLILGRCLAGKANLQLAGFMIAYTLMNAGAFITMALARTILNLWGFHGSFLICAILFLCALFCFLMASRTLYPLCHESRMATQHILKRLVGMMLLLILVPITMYCLEPNQNTQHILLVGCVLCGYLIGHLYIKKSSYSQRRRLMLFLVLTAFSIIFWILYALEPSLLTRYITTHVDRQFFSHAISSHDFYTLNPLFILLIGSLLSIIWLRAREAHTLTSRAYQIAIGLACMGLGYLILAASTYFSSTNDLVSAIWVLMTYGLLSAAELQISPVGLALVSRLSFKDDSAKLIGIWLFMNGLGTAIANRLLSHTFIQPRMTIEVYGHHFMYLGITALTFATLLALLTPTLTEKLQRKAHDNALTLQPTSK